MKNFIKSHPYLSCAGLALATTTPFAVIEADKKCGFFRVFAISTLLCTMPSILTATIDRYFHHHITDNKPIQYGLTAAETVLSIPSIVSIMTGENKFNECFKDLFSLSLSNKRSKDTKIITAIGVIQSLGFKYILDSADEQSEIIETEGYLESDSQILIEI